MSTKDLQRLARKLFSSEEDQQKFEASVLSGSAGQTALLWFTDPQFGTSPPPWAPNFVRLATDARPGLHPLHDEGAFYCLDLSSIFEMVPAMQCKPASNVLDMCASPGGKSLVAERQLEPQLLISNETIGKRLKPLISNFERCMPKNALISSSDSSYFASQFAAYFDLVIVDAPCSGQSLVARGEDNKGAFHPANINLCSNRQKRIIANAAQSVASGGYLLYSTCTYSVEENEHVVRWLLKKFPMFESVPSPLLDPFLSPLSPAPCYRLWPWQGYGAGGFTALFRRTDDLRRGAPDAAFRPVWRSHEDIEL